MSSLPITPGIRGKASSFGGNVLANACDGGGYRRFVFVKRKDGHLAYVRQYAALRENEERDHKEIIEYMNAKQSRQLAAMERKQNLRIWSP